MPYNVILLGWNRPVPGRERSSIEHFQELTKYLGDLRDKGAIRSFDTVLLQPHGGDLNGFFLIRGESTKLVELTDSAEWLNHIMRAMQHTQGVGALSGVEGDFIPERLERWTRLLAS